MLEGIVLGIIQGVTEWLPISSEGVVVLVKTNFFCGQFWYGETVCDESLTELIGMALFLHLGTFLAAAWYLRDDIVALLKALFKPHRMFRDSGEIEKMLRFLVVSTFISGIIGFFLLEIILPTIEAHVVPTGRVITGLVGVLLLITGVLEFQAKRKRKGIREIMQLKDKDAGLLGVVQGFSALPGFSRSGLTISALLLRKFDETTALRLSFLMSLPIVLGGNILLNAQGGFSLSVGSLLGLVFSFLFGILTIHVLFRIAKKVNFAYFVFAFGILAITAAFLPV